MEVPPWLSSKESTCSAGAARDPGSILGSGRSLGGGHGNPFQYSSLGNPMDRGAWQTTVFKVAKNQTWLKRLSMQACKQHVGLTLVAQWSRICLPMQGTQVQPLVGELRSHMPWSNQAYVLLLLKHPWTVHLNVSACRSPHLPCNENIQVLIFHPFYPKSTDRESILFTESEIRAQTKIIFIWFQKHLFSLK